jgi:hypothetical protein
MRVLFLGNSQIICNCNVPEIITKLSQSSTTPQARIEADVVAIGGASIETLWNDGRPLSAIQKGGWDWVLCHEIIYSYGGNGARLREFGRKFNQEIKKAGARTLFYATGDVAGVQHTHRAMYEDAATLAKECEGSVAGGGMAWLKAWQKQPDLDFHCSDRAHPSEKGYYLNACVIIAALTNCSPMGLSPCFLSKPDAEFLQGIAWEQYHEDRQSEKQ